MRNVPGVDNNIAGAQSRVQTGCDVCINQLNIPNDGYRWQFSNVLYDVSDKSRSRVRSLKVRHNHDAGSVYQRTGSPMAKDIGTY